MEKDMEAVEDVLETNIDAPEPTQHQSRPQGRTTPGTQTSKESTSADSSNTISRSNSSLSPSYRPGTGNSHRPQTTESHLRLSPSRQLESCNASVSSLPISVSSPEDLPGAMPDEELEAPLVSDAPLIANARLVSAVDGAAPCYNDLYVEPDEYDVVTSRTVPLRGEDGRHGAEEETSFISAQRSRSRTRTASGPAPPSYNASVDNRLTSPGARIHSGGVDRSGSLPDYDNIRGGRHSGSSPYRRRRGGASGGRRSDGGRYSPPSYSDVLQMETFAVYSENGGGRSGTRLDAPSVHGWTRPDDESAAADDLASSGDPESPPEQSAEVNKACLPCSRVLGRLAPVLARYRPKQFGKREKLIVGGTVAVLLCVLFMATFTPSFNYVEYYQTAIVRSKTTGAIEKEVYHPGCYVIGVHREFIYLPSTAQILHVEDFGVFTLSGFSATISWSLQYFIRADRAISLYTGYGPKYEPVLISRIQATIRNTMAASFYVTTLLLNRTLVERTLHAAIVNKTQDGCLPDEVACGEGFPVDVVYFQLGEIQLHEIVQEKLFQITSLKIDTATAMFEQQRMVEEKITSLQVQQILNNATEIQSGGAAEAEAARIVSQAEADSISEIATSRGLTMMKSALNITSQDHILSLFWLNSLKDVDQVCPDVGFGSNSFHLPGA